jgi:hypothetical protein
MDFKKILAELYSERERLDQAIFALEKIGGATGAKRRGRPPKWLAEAKGSEFAAPAPKKRTLSPEARKRIADAQKKRWAAAKKSKG